MRAAHVSGPRQIGVHSVPLPRPGNDEVVVKVGACGICGSDLHFFAGTLPPPLGCPGHEIAGEVAELGTAVRGIKAGDHVAIEPIIRCGRCRSCAVGSYQLCDHFRVLGTTHDGGFADFVRAPAYTLFPLPQRMEHAVGALAEPLAVGIHGVRLGGVGIGQRVTILGAGTIGLLAIVAARAAGAADVAITARYPHQAAAARARGVNDVFAADDHGMADLRRSGEQHPIDVVVETVGGEANTLSDGLAIVRKGGRIVVLGLFTRPPTLDPLLLVMKEPRIVGSLTYGREGPRADFEIAIDLLAREADHVAGLVTHRFGLDAIGTAFSTAADKSGGAVKVTVTP
jgi:2-desacetyl-2-hydroxyethyl bacteriochlorophyllide A dehydrogenase